MRAAPVVLIAVAACSHAQPRPAAHAPTSAFATGAGGVSLHYLDFGGEGDPIVLLPGAGNSAWIYGSFGRDLARQHRVFALTRRGHGESAQPADGYDLPVLAADLLAFLDQQHLERVVLVGHSLAGAELTYVAGAHPDRVRALVYLDAAYDRTTQGDMFAADPIEVPAPTTSDTATAAAFIDHVHRTRPDLARYWTDDIQKDLAVSVGPLEDGRFGWKTKAIFGLYWLGTSSSPPDYARVKAPTLAIYSVEDETFNLPADASPELRAKHTAFVTGPLRTWREQSIAQLRAGISTVRIEQMAAGHHLFVHKPVETLALVEQFLSGLPRE